MADGQKYLVRDPQGSVYGPADGEMLRAWVREGRIVPGMHIAPRETREWVEASLHPETAGALALRAAELGTAIVDVPASGTPALSGSEVTTAPAPRDDDNPTAQAAPLAGPEAPPAEAVSASTPEPAAYTEVIEGEVEADEPRHAAAYEADPAPVEAAPLEPVRGPAAAPVADRPSAPTSLPSWTPGPATPLPPSVPSRPPSIQDLTYAAPPRHNVPGILSLTFGALAIPLSCGCGCLPLVPITALLALAAIILGVVSLQQISSNPAAFRGKGMPTAGIALGTTVLLLILCMIAYIVVSSLMAAKGP
jgi:hypothetical protein